MASGRAPVENAMHRAVRSSCTPVALRLFPNPAMYTGPFSRSGVTTRAAAPTRSSAATPGAAIAKASSHCQKPRLFRDTLLHLLRLQLPLMIQITLPLGNPLSRSLPLQITVEPGEDPPLIIHLVRLLPQSVIFAAVHQQHHIFMRAPRDVVQLHSLV